MPESDEDKRSGSSPGPATEEELEQLEELAAGHPWQVPLASFLKRVASEYGFEICEMEACDVSGARVRLFYLRNRETGGVVHLPGNLRMEDQLDPLVVRSLCRRIRIPPEDFGLLPDEPDDEDWEN